jgi:hypothetical protein
MDQRRIGRGEALRIDAGRSRRGLQLAAQR